MSAHVAGWIRVRVTPPRGAPPSAIERVGPLTPYLAQTVVEDALALGRGSTVQFDSCGEDAAQLLETLRPQVAVLASRGIGVAVRTGERTTYTPPRRNAA